MFGRSKKGLIVKTQNSTYTVDIEQMTIESARGMYALVDYQKPKKGKRWEFTISQVSINDLCYMAPELQELYKKTYSSSIVESVTYF